MKAYSYLSAEERIRIDELRNRDGLGVRQIAPRTGRTWDNGTESSCHVLVDESLGMLAYFADPYSSYQRGGNENHNGRIRRHLPKRTGFDGLTDADLQAIVQEINGTPHEGPGLGNVQRGLVPRARQGNVKDKPPKDEL